MSTPHPLDLAIKKLTKLALQYEKIAEAQDAPIILATPALPGSGRRGVVPFLRPYPLERQKRRNRPSIQHRMEKFCRRPRQPVAEKGKAGDVSLSVSEASFKRSTGLNALKSAGGAKRLSAENSFLLDVGSMMETWKKGSSKFELANSGVWWRTRYRINPDLIQRVLADTLCAVKEGRIKESPGQFAVDLWKRWSLDLLKKKPQLKTAAALMK